MINNLRHVSGQNLGGKGKAICVYEVKTNINY